MKTVIVYSSDVMQSTWCGWRDICYHHFAPLLPLQQSLCSRLLLEHGVHCSRGLLIKLGICILQFISARIHIRLKDLLNIP